MDKNINPPTKSTIKEYLEKKEQYENDTKDYTKKIGEYFNSNNLKLNLMFTINKTKV